MCFFVPANLHGKGCAPGGNQCRVGLRGDFRGGYNRLGEDRMGRSVGRYDKFAIFVRCRRSGGARKKRAMKKYWGIIALLLAVALAVFVYYRFFFVFGEGVKSGELNYVVYKGLVFKTYEGKLIQSGIRSQAVGSIQSYEFEFSVENPTLARELMLQGGKTLGLHYKEYFGALPWRGFTKFIVDSIVTVPSAQEPRSALRPEP